MKSRRIDILGGGPAGLFLGQLLKFHRPSWKVLVHERQSPDETFGFGVSFTRRTLHNISVADPQTHDALLAASYPIERSEIRTPFDAASASNLGNVAIGRTVLLRLLLERALAVGVEIEMGKRTHLSELSDADVVVAADGVGSATRQALADILDVEITHGRGLYLWCGAAGVVLNGITFASVETEHGLFVTHAYPYSHESSTFLVETDETTWRRAGFAASSAALTPGETDETSLRYLEQAFRDLLRGTSLIGNRTQWLRFRTIHCQRWHHKNIVLIGDAAHTAHYSVGSGTKMAMEDAIALCDALLSNDDLSTAFTQFEQSRRPAVERLQTLAARSQFWWDSYGIRRHLPAAELLVSYFTRMGTVRFSQLAETDRATVTAAVAAFVNRPLSLEDTGEFARQVLAEPFQKGRLSLSGRLLGNGWNDVSPAAIAIPSTETALNSYPNGTDAASPWENTTSPLSYVEVLCSEDIAAARERFPNSLLFGVVPAGSIAAWTPEGDALLNACRHFQDAGSDGILFKRGNEGRSSLLAHLDLAERLCLESRGIVAVEGEPEYLDDLVAGVVAHRTDLVVLTSSHDTQSLVESGDLEDL